jgi:hypothetical protein
MMILTSTALTACGGSAQGETAQAPKHWHQMTQGGTSFGPELQATVSGDVVSVLAVNRKECRTTLWNEATQREEPGEWKTCETHPASDLQLTLTLAPKTPGGQETTLHATTDAQGVARFDLAAVRTIRDEAQVRIRNLRQTTEVSLKDTPMRAASIAEEALGKGISTP